MQELVKGDILRCVGESGVQTFSLIPPLPSLALHLRLLRGTGSRGFWGLLGSTWKLSVGFSECAGVVGHVLLLKPLYLWTDEEMSPGCNVAKEMRLP